MSPSIVAMKIVFKKKTNFYVYVITFYLINSDIEIESIRNMINMDGNENNLLSNY